MVEEKAPYEPVWRVRIILRGGIMHCLSRTKPEQLRNGWSWEHIDDNPYGDTVKVIDWNELIGFSYRVDDKLCWCDGAVRTKSEALELHRVRTVVRLPDGSTVRLNEQPQS